MAKQDGIIPLKGTIDNITFYKSGDGYLARKKTDLDASRIASDPAFARTRETGAEFTRAGQATKLLGDALRSYVQVAADSKMVSRLTRAMMKVIKADRTSVRGQRNVIDGEAELLKGFEFNIDGRLTSVVGVEYTKSIDRVTGQIKADFPAFIPNKKIKAPAGATHYRLIVAGLEADFENKKYVLNAKESAQLPWDNVETAVLSLTAAVTANSTHPLFLIGGVCRVYLGSIPGVSPLHPRSWCLESV